ncbi:MAG: tetratricopeptide repeat protein [Thermoanaerobaculia bacterium]|nr:tetratricopeptide repeat protein [Thermoanaerobaculia bacterium]
MIRTATLPALTVLFLLGAFPGWGAPPLPEWSSADLEPTVARQLEAAQEVWRAIPDEANPELRAAVAGEVGRVFHAYGFHRVARTGYQHAAELQPADPTWPHLLGLAALDAGDPEAARTAFRQALELEPGSLAARAALARLHLESGNPGRATELLDPAPSLPGVLALRAEIALAEGRWEDAVEFLEAVLEEIPEADRLHYLLGRAYRGLGEMEKAREHLAERGTVGVAVSDPLRNWVEAVRRGERTALLTGQVAFRAGRYEDAVAAFRQAVEAAPSSSRARIDLAAALAATGAEEEAERELERALEHEPDNATAHYNLGLLLSPDPRAILHLRRAAYLAGDDGEIHQALGNELLRRKAWDEAFLAFEEARNLDPHRTGAHLGAIQALAQQERYEEALTVIEEARAVIPENRALDSALVQILTRAPDPELRNGDLALRVAESLYARSRDRASRLLLADALAERGRCREALQLVRPLLSDSGEESGSPELLRRAARYESGPPCGHPLE